jgi:hypothetical protein
MTKGLTENHDSDGQLYAALSRWDGEGGAGPFGAQETAEEADANVPPLGHAALIQLRVRVIALENLVIALFADASDTQRARAAEMAGFITPRFGCTPHPLTVRAATKMNDLVERASAFRSLIARPRSD